MGHIDLQLHGSAMLCRAGEPPLPLRGRAALLVALVSLEPGVSRERAARLLWPDAPRPRHNLRQQLLRFRQALGAALIEGDEHLRLGAGVRLAPAAPGAELLADETPGDDEASGWLQHQRAVLGRATQAAGRQAVADAERNGDLDAALQAALALCAAAPHDEAALATLMRVHYLRGEGASGLVVYRELERRLQAWSGARPAAATLALAQALQRADAAAGPLAPAQLPITLRRPPRRVGRQAEWQALQRGCEQGQAVLVEGEAGMGKSRLLADWRAHAGPWLGAAGRPGDAGVPYATLARLLHPLLQDGTPPLDDATRQALAPLWQPGGTGAAVRPDALATAVATLLAQARVHTVCLDDLHFTDDATLDLVSTLARSAAPPVWLLARRPAEGSVAATRLVDTLAEEGRLLPLRLQPLATADVAQLIDDLALPAAAGAGLAEPLCRHTGGNPLFLLETLKQGLVDGSLARGELPRPDGVGVLIERRLLRLSAPSLTLARVAAIAGIDFSIELAEAATGQPAVQLAAAWQELQDAQVLRDEAFAHDLVADVVLRGVPQVVARRVHAQCAQWLAAHHGEPARVARHWQLGGLPAEAAQAYRQAADRALRASRRSEEAELLMQAARCHGEAGDAAQRFDALATRALALVAAQIDEHTLQEVQELEAQAVDDRQRVRAIRVHMDLLGQHGQFQRVVELGLRGLALARALNDRPEQARLAAELAGSLGRLGRCDEALDVMRPQLAWIDTDADDETRHLWHGYWAATLGQLGRLRDALASYDTSIAAAERLGRRDVVGSTMLNQGVVFRTLGRQSAAHACSRRALALLADDPVETTQRTLARLMHARDQAETGQFAEALQAFDAVEPRLAAMGGGFWTVASRTAQAQLWLHLGQMARAQQALATDDAATPVWMRAGRRLLRMEIAHWLHQPAPAGAVAEALALAEADPARQVSSQARALRACPAEQVLAEVPALAERARAQERFGVLMALRTHEARAALRLGETARAAESARAALALHAEGFAPEFMYGPEPQLVAWQALQAAGAPSEADTALQAGAGWVRLHLPNVPAPFLDSYLNRNPVNRELLAALRS